MAKRKLKTKRTSNKQEPPKYKKALKTDKKLKKINKTKNKVKSLDQLKEIRKFYANKKQTQMTKTEALKYLKSLVEKYDFDKRELTFSEYLEERCRKSEKFNHIVEISGIFSDDVYSLTNYLEDNDFTENDLSDINSDKDYKKIKKQNNNIIKGPLNGKTIVLTGEMMIDRNDLTEILIQLGARVTSAVSSKTNILIHGKFLEDGRIFTEGKKYKMAKQNKIEIYSDEEFEKYMQKLLKRKKWNMKCEAEKIKLNI